MGTAPVEAKARSQQSPAAAIKRVGVGGQGGRRAPHIPRAVAHDVDAARAIVVEVIRRIEDNLEQETAALDKAPNFDLKASNDRKSQGLVDLNQAMRRLKPSDIDEDLNLRLQTFRAKLDVNLRKIRLHLEAVKEIAGMLSDAIQNAESDGTYTRHIGPSRSTQWSD
ncbi:hypothetical protein [Hyphomicrobium sp. 99]|uniref:hypothetical protein n=1 Tax=Hyphomicrobium sp. 99 TaxID=1163419 RepID=UPI000696CE4F|nr:hypothetical protein [Hyphomicrobium sp. 99]